MTTKEKIAVMQAYLDGKTIQFYSAEEGKWDDEDTEPSWNWDEFEYRVKPESKLRPYKDADECFQEAKKHGFWIKCVDAKVHAVGSYFQIYNINGFFATYLGDCSFEKLKDSFVWADDGTKCGIIEK